MFLPLELTLRPSRICLALMALAHGLALAGIWLAVLPGWAQGLLTAALLTAARQLWRESRRQPRGLRVSRSGQLELLEGEWRTAKLRGRPVVLPWLVSVELVPKAGKARRLILWPDSAPADGLRKLRVWLKWGALNLTAPASALRTPQDRPGRGGG